MLRGIPFPLILWLASTAWSDEADLHARRGADEYRKQNYDASIDSFRKAAELKPGSAAIQYDLGTTLIQKGKFQEAGEALARSLNLEKNPSEANSFYNLGYSRVKEALAPPAQPSDPSALGSAEPPQPDPQETLKKLKSGLEAFRQAVIAKPGDRDAKYNYETTKMMVRKLEEQMKNQQQSGDGDKKDQKSGDQGDEKQENKDHKNDDQGDQNKGGENKENSESKDSKDDQSPDQQDQQDSDQNKNGEDDTKSSNDQKSGLEATATPTPSSSPGEQPSPEKKDQDQSPQEASQGEGTPPPLTPEQLDAMRVLNSLAQEKPEQFKRLFRFQGRGTGKRPDKDW